MRRTVLPLLVLAVLVGVAGLRAEPPTEPPVVDIRKISPDDLRGVDVADLVREANRAYQEKRFEDAAGAYIEALRQSPGDSLSLYNLACCFGLLGEAGQAARFLDAAFAAGFRDIGHIRYDPDFESVREDEAFVAVMKKLSDAAERTSRLRGELIPVIASTLATVRVLAPETEEPWKRLPLVVGLHGFGANIEGFAKVFLGRGVEQPFIYCVPQAPYAFGSGPRPGFSWNFMGEGAEQATKAQSHLLTERYVLEAIETVKRHYPVDERNVFLMGFSQGAGQAYSIGLKHPELFRGVIPIGGWLDPAEHPLPRARRAAEHGLFLVCHSPEDRAVEWEACETAKSYLEEHRIPHAVLSYPGGHSIPTPVAQAIASWIADPKPVAPALPAAPPTPDGEDR